MTYHLLQSKRRNLPHGCHYLIGYQQPECFVVTGFCMEDRWRLNVPITTKSYDFLLEYCEEVDKAGSVEELMQKHFEIFL